jgi:predicted DNA-binding transcriptional regulator AlpA
VIENSNQVGALRRVQAAAYCNVSSATFYRIGPKPDVSTGRIRLWRQETLDKWLAGDKTPVKRKKS